MDALKPLEGIGRTEASSDCREAGDDWRWTMLIAGRTTLTDAA